MVNMGDSVRKRNNRFKAKRQMGIVIDQHRDELKQVTPDKEVTFIPNG
jgi:hypothetical protein